MFFVLAPVRLLLLASSVCPLMDGAKRFFLDGKGWQLEKLGLSLVGRALLSLLSKALIQLSADEWGCTPSLVVVWPEATQPWGLQALW